MVNFLLQFPESYCTHSFRTLYYSNAGRIAVAAHADAVNIGEPLLPPEHDGFVSVSAAEELCTSVAEEQEPTDAGDVQDELSDQDDPEQPGEPGQSMNGVLPRTRLIVAMQHLDYEHRGPVLAEWSWYFYIAGVCKVKLRNYSEGDQVFPFSDAHPEARFLAQRVLHSTPWRVPLLLGPAVPNQSVDPEKRAMLLLLLFRPWKGAVSTLLTCDDSVNAADCNSWPGPQDFEHRNKSDALADAAEESTTSSATEDKHLGSCGVFARSETFCETLER